MNEEIVIHSIIRHEKGKNSVRKLHHAGFIPAVVYGHNFTPLSLSLNASDINKIFKPGSLNIEDYRLWKLVINAKDAISAKRIAEEVTVARSMEKGLLANPHSQSYVFL